MTHGDSLRDARDALQAKIGELEFQQSMWRQTLSDLVTDHWREQAALKIDALSDEIGRLEAALDEADAAVARDDPELGVWGYDGL